MRVITLRPDNAIIAEVLMYVRAVYPVVIAAIFCNGYIYDMPQMIIIS